MSDQDESEKFEKVGEIVSIFLRGESWYANLQHEGKQVRSSLKTKSKKQARLRAIRLERDILEGRRERTKRAPTIEAIADAYLANLRTEKKAKKTLSKIELVRKRIL